MRRPTTMGTISELYRLSMKEVVCMKILGIHYRRKTIDDVMDLVELPEEELKIEMQHQSKLKRYEGLKSVAPAGCPPVQFLDRTKFQRIHAFSYTVSVDPVSVTDNAMTYAGESVQNFRPCLWGGYSVRMAEESGAYLGFGIGYLDGEPYVFYQLKGLDRHDKEVCVVKIDDTARFGISTRKNIKIAYVTARDFTPFQFGDNPMMTVEGVTASKSAMASYRGYAHSKAERGFGFMQEVYSSHRPRSYLPNHVRAYCQPYPFDNPDAETIEGYKSFFLEGNKGHRVKCFSGPMPPTVIHLDGPQIVLSQLPYVDDGPEWG
jgi:hypothetical protein